MTEPTKRAREPRLPGLAKLDAVMKAALGVSNKTVREKMAAEKATRARKRQRAKAKKRTRR
jgi:hypothetical protein